MRFSIRLAQLLGHVPDPRKRPGTIKSIVEYTGLDRHQVAAMLKNEAKYIPLHALSRLCDYLIEHGYATADQLPGELFGVEPERFWELLARRKRLELCLGVRKTGGLEGALVVASDSVLLGELLSGVSTLGGTAKHRRSDAGEGHSGESGNGTIRHEMGSHLEHLKQSLVWSPGQGTAGEVMRRAQQIYNDFSEAAEDKALMCLGSVKSNPVVELMLADTFGCEPFVSQDDVTQPRDRSCPLFLRYRAKDPHLDSCSGGMQLSRESATREPGIYYETASGEWRHCKWDDTKHDAAFLFYIHREPQGRLDMALGGFSGRATRMLAKTLATRSEDFWPPIYEGHGLQVGMFVVKYSFQSKDDAGDALLTVDPTARIETIPLDAEVIARRIEH